MTPFEKWAKTAKDFSSEAVWKAACEYQKEQDAKICDAYAADRYALYKGRKPYEGHEPERANPHTDGESDGAEYCAHAIREQGEMK